MLNMTKYQVQALMEMICEIHVATRILWCDKYPINLGIRRIQVPKDAELTKNVLRAQSKVKVDVSACDALHFLQVNVIWQLMSDPYSTIIRLTNV